MVASPFMVVFLRDRERRKEDSRNDILKYTIWGLTLQGLKTSWLSLAKMFSSLIENLDSYIPHRFIQPGYVAIARVRIKVY
jgi:hypothetical protein